MMSTQDANTTSKKLASNDFVSRVLQGFVSVGGAAALVAALQIVSTAVLARYVSPSEWGGAAFAISAFGFALAVGQFGLTQAMVHVNDISEAHVSAASLSAWIFSGACAALFVGIATLLETASGIGDLHRYMYALAPCIVIRAVSGITEGTILRQQRFSLVSAIELGSYAVGACVGIALAVWGGGPWALVCAHVAATATRIGALISCTGLAVWTRPASSMFQEILPFAGGQTIAQSANYIATESDNIIVGATFGPAALGAYGRAYQLAVAPANLLSSAIDKVFYPSLVLLRRTNAPLGPTYLAATELAVTLALPAATLAIVAAPEIVQALMGPNWTAVVVPLRILSLGLIFRALFQMSDCFCRAVGAVYGSGVRQGVYAVCVIAGALVGSLWGPAGVAAGVVTAMAAKYTLMLQLSLKELGVPLPSYLASTARGFRTGSAVTLAVWFTILFCRHADSPALLTCTAAALVFAIATALKFWPVTDNGLAAS